MAAALVDFRKAPESTRVVHLIHPRPVSWSSLAGVVSSMLSVPLVPYTDWLAKLEQAASSLSQSEDSGETQGDSIDLLRDLRAVRLLSFFKAIKTNSLDGEALGFPHIDITQAVAASTTLSDPELHQLDAGDVARWLGYWRKVGLLSNK